MLTLEQTGLEIFSFGDEPEDVFYILVNKLVSPEGINFDRLKLSDPRYFDAALDEAGCIVMLSNEELDELVRRKEVNKDNVHATLYELAAREGLLP